MTLFIRGPATLLIEQAEIPAQRRFASHVDYVEILQGIPAVRIADGDVGAFCYSDTLQRWLLVRILGIVDHKSLGRWDDDGGAAG